MSNHKTGSLQNNSPFWTSKIEILDVLETTGVELSNMLCQYEIMFLNARGLHLKWLFLSQEVSKMV
jgi:hypothetical protein